jgi:alpha-beta hydrolase superfamily lysophospholipase
MIPLSRRSVGAGGLGLILGTAGAAAAAPLARSGPLAPQARMTTQRFAFVSAGRRLVGLYDTPADGAARGLVVILHGYGATDIANRTSWFDLRSRFTALGLATLVWDKPGCGESEGVFDPDQPVAERAAEVLDAAAQVRASGLPGADRIGLWGISRAGWIAPLALDRAPALAFWISVSGTDARESFGYLLETNLPLEGRSPDEVAALLGEWRRGQELTRAGAPFAEVLAATTRLRADPFLVWLGARWDEAGYLADQARYRSGVYSVDSASGLRVYVPDFEALLSRITVPVLALFGERDTSVDWRSTAALYARTMGANPRADLTVRTFPDGNHNLHRSATGGLREMIDMPERRAVDGYYETMAGWLGEKVGAG